MLNKTVSKIAKIAEQLQAELGRIDDPHSLSPDEWMIINQLRRDVSGAFNRFKMSGLLWRVQLRNLDPDKQEEVLGYVFANSRDDAFEEALARWGSSYPPSALEVKQEPLSR